jgi:hypothetical protein
MDSYPYFRTTRPAPVLNTPLWKAVFCYPLPLDDQGLLRAVECILLRDSLVKIIERCSDEIVRIETSEYEGDALYMDRRFLERADDRRERQKENPSIELLLHRLHTWPTTQYIWGGNVARGVPELAEYYPMPSTIDSLSQKIWTLQGLDCSGLLYAATGGSVPRNTAGLLRVGREIPLEGRNQEEILELLSPGDILIWPGHLVIVENGRTTVESRVIKGGVIRTNLRERLEEIMETQEPGLSLFARTLFYQTPDNLRDASSSDFNV